jgi:predicted RNase H-like HicB family nuclease
MKRYLVVVEKTETGYSAYSPDLWGCIAAGATREEVERNMREAIELHLEAMAEDGTEPPLPQSYSIYCEAV